MSATVVEFPHAPSRRRGERRSRIRSAVLFLVASAKRLGAAHKRRRALLAADDRTLADLGISRAQAHFLATERIMPTDQGLARRNAM